MPEDAARRKEKALQEQRDETEEERRGNLRECK